MLGELKTTKKNVHCISAANRSERVKSPSFAISLTVGGDAYHSAAAVGTRLSIPIGSQLKTGGKKTAGNGEGEVNKSRGRHMHKTIQ